MVSWRLPVFVLVALAVLAPAMVSAQAPRTPATTPPAAAPAQPPRAAPAAPAPTSRLLENLIPPPAPPLPDYAEEMRVLVQKISAYTRTLKPDFGIVIQNGLELLQKADELDPRRKAPARTLLRSINGVLQSPLYFGRTKLDEPLREEDTKALLELTDLARHNGAKVLVMDYGKETKTIDAAHRQSRKQGYVSYTADAFGPEIRALARHPSRPYEENSDSVVSLADVRNFFYLRDIQGWGRQDEFALKVHNRNHDLVVVDVFHGRTVLQKQAVETMKYKKLGARRLVYAYVDIGHAGSYQYFWKDEWRAAPPGWIGDPMPNDPDTFFVKYWEPGWQNLLFGNPNSFIYGIFKLGFDGIVLDGVDAFRFFEGR